MAWNDCKIETKARKNPKKSITYPLYSCAGPLMGYRRADESDLKPLFPLWWYQRLCHRICHFRVSQVCDFHWNLHCFCCLNAVSFSRFCEIWLGGFETKPKKNEFLQMSRNLVISKLIGLIPKKYKLLIRTRGKFIIKLVCVSGHMLVYFLLLFIVKQLAAGEISEIIMYSGHLCEGISMRWQLIFSLFYPYETCVLPSFFCIRAPLNWFSAMIKQFCKILAFFSYWMIPFPGLF